MTTEPLTVEQVAATYRVAASKSSTTHDLLAQMTIELNATLDAAREGQGLDVEFDQLTKALEAAWRDGHRAGVGCGHDLAVCRHDDGAVKIEVDDLASWNEAVQDARAALHSTNADPEEPTDD